MDDFISDFFHFDSGANHNPDEHHDSIHADSIHPEHPVDQNHFNHDPLTSFDHIHDLFSSFLSSDQDLKLDISPTGDDAVQHGALQNGGDSAVWHVISDDHFLADSGTPNISLIATGSEDSALALSTHLQSHHVHARVAFSGSAGQINPSLSSTTDPGASSAFSSGYPEIPDLGLINLSIAGSPYDSQLISELNDFMMAHRISAYITQINEMGIPVYKPLKDWQP